MVESSFIDQDGSSPDDFSQTNNSISGIKENSDYNHEHTYTNLDDVKDIVENFATLFDLLSKTFRTLPKYSWYRPTAA